MNISIRSKSLILTPDFKNDLEHKLARIYGKASETVKKISVSFSDINGPKGGEDKQCKLRLTLSGFPAIHIETRKTSIELAFLEALKRANQVLFRRIKKQQRFHHHPIHMAAADLSV